MANFNASLWYHLYNKPSKADAFIGTNLNANNGNAGAVFWESTGGHTPVFPTGTTERRQSPVTLPTVTPDRAGS